MDENRKNLEELWAKYDDLGRVAKDLQFWARRYCDGRMTYAVNHLNQLTAQLLELGIVPLKDKDTIWAKDGDPNITNHQAYVNKYGMDGAKFIDSIIEKIGEDFNK